MEVDGTLDEIQISRRNAALMLIPIIILITIWYKPTLFYKPCFDTHLTFRKAGGATMEGEELYDFESSDYRFIESSQQPCVARVASFCIKIIVVNYVKNDTMPIFLKGEELVVLPDGIVTNRTSISIMKNCTRFAFTEFKPIVRIQNRTFNFQVNRDNSWTIITDFRTPLSRR